LKAYDYHYPKLSSIDLGFIRSPGPGLGNLLLPISRALIGSIRYQGIFIHPTIPQLKIGPIIRRETDKRVYWSILKARSVSQWKDFLRIWSVPNRCGEMHAYDVDSCLIPKTSRVIRYEGLKNYFHDLEGFEMEIYDWISKNTLPEAPQISPPDVVVHIRQGDFSEYNPHNVDTCYQTPFDWYADAIKLATKASTRSNDPVLLLTDGFHQDVARQIDLNNYVLPPSGYTALQTILLGAKAKILIASKSTFSMWMRFLGKSQVYWEPEFDISRYLKVTKRDLIIN